MRLWLIKLLLGKAAFGEIEKETDYLYKKIWPKHKDYAAITKAQIRKSLLRARYK